MADPIELDTLLGHDWTWRLFGNAPMLVTSGGGAKVVICGRRGGFLDTRGADGVLMPLDGETALGKLLAAVPAIVEAARYVSAIRSTNWEDDEDDEQLSAWKRLDAAFELAGIELNVFGQAPLNGEEGAR